jgi:hypothetical protein
MFCFVDGVEASFYDFRQFLTVYTLRRAPQDKNDIGLSNTTLESLLEPDKISCASRVRVSTQTIHSIICNSDGFFSCFKVVTAKTGQDFFLKIRILLFFKSRLDNPVEDLLVSGSPLHLSRLQLLLLFLI